MDTYSREYEIRWDDLDANGHVNYSTYIDATADMRYHFLREHGYPTERFKEVGIGLIYTAISARFFREVLYGEMISITYLVTGLSPSGARWKVHHDVLKANGKKAVAIDLEGTLLDLTTRRPAVPPTGLIEVFNLIPRAHEVEVMSDTRWAVPA